MSLKERLYFLDALRAFAILMMLQGHFISGVLDPVFKSPENSLVNVDYALLLAWIFKDDIIKKENNFINNGGKFIIPMPKPHFEP